MITRYKKTVNNRGPEKVEKTQESRAGGGSDGTCRCKETSVMTPRELLKLMMSDLSFWKKTKKG
jgi:hypothetical protein